VRKSRLGPPHQPPGSLSQFVEYVDPVTGAVLAQVHRYLLTDGSLGASGHPDPKTVVIQGVVYKTKGVTGHGPVPITRRRSRK
jgi:hypothetical protein